MAVFRPRGPAIGAATAAPRPRGREAKGADAPARRLRAAFIGAATAAPRPRGREAKGADAPARRLRAALMSHHQGSMV